VSVIEIRKGQAPAKLARAEFGERFRQAYFDPLFRVEDQSIARLEEIAWQIYLVGRKAPFTQKAGPGYADPDYELSIEWLATKQRIEAAQRQWSDAQMPNSCWRKRAFTAPRMPRPVRRAALSRSLR
jgi:hypothetical protein